MPAPAKSRARRFGWALEALALLALAVLACWGVPLRFPPGPASTEQAPEGLVRAYALHHTGQPDYFTVQNAQGRIFRIGYDTTGDGKPDSFVNLDELRIADCRHLVIILDGMPYGVVEAYRQKGGLRLFYPPSRLISTYPAHTDLALTDAFASTRCIAFEAVHYDHVLNQVVGGDLDYLALRNESWARDCDYRAVTLLDPFSYLVPEKVFKSELGEVLGLLDRKDCKDRGLLVAYLISTAGLATREGEAGLLKTIEAIDRLCEEVVWRTRGRTRITLFSDHGHTMTPCRRIDFQSFLAGKGWRVSDRLDGPRDVALVEYGLVTNALFAAKDRAGLAADLVQCQGARRLRDGRAPGGRLQVPGRAGRSTGAPAGLRETQGRGTTRRRRLRGRPTAVRGDRTPRIPRRMQPALVCVSRPRRRDARRHRRHRLGLVRRQPVAGGDAPERRQHARRLGADLVDGVLYVDPWPCAPDLQEPRRARGHAGPDRPAVAAGARRPGRVAWRKSHARHVEPAAPEAVQSRVGFPGKKTIISARQNQPQAGRAYAPQRPVARSIIAGAAPRPA
jgi:hypothetical protein